MGAGTPMVATLHRLCASGDEIHKVEGSFSGTLAYVTSELSPEKSFSSIVRTALSLGYTEPDPRDDLGGVDVARKALILARGLGRKLELSDIKVDPLYPPEMDSLSIPEFLEAVSSLDKEYKEKAEKAKENGTVLRFAASITEKEISVGLQECSAESPLGRLQGTLNMVAFHTRVYHEAPVVVMGAGAGGEVTAAGVIADMVNVSFAL